MAEEAPRPREPGTAPAGAAGVPPTADRLRADIDGGKTGEKVPFPDPAAAPLGTDDEAAGAGPTLRERHSESVSRPRVAPSRGLRPGPVLLGAGAVTLATVIILAALI